MAYQIRSLTFAEILDTAFRLLRDRFRVLAGVGAVIYVPAGIIAAMTFGARSSAPGRIWVGLGLYLLIALAGLPLAQLAVTHAVSETYLGRRLGIGQAYSKGFAVYLPYLGTAVLVGLAVLLGFALLVIPGIYVAVRWLLVGPIAVIEGAYGTRAMERSWDLMQGNWWRGLGIVLAASLILWLPANALGFAFAFIPVLGPILNALVESIAFVFNAAVLVLLYFDLRCRHEDFDLRYLAWQVGGGSEREPRATSG